MRAHALALALGALLGLVAVQLAGCGGDAATADPAAPPAAVTSPLVGTWIHDPGAHRSFAFGADGNYTYVNAPSPTASGWYRDDAAAGVVWIEDGSPSGTGLSYTFTDCDTYNQAHPATEIPHPAAVTSCVLLSAQGYWRAP